MKNLSHYLLITCILLISDAILAHEAVGGPRKGYPEFISITGKNGIPMSGITALTVDDDGFIWGASRMGIVRATPEGSRTYDLPVATSDVMQMKLAYGGGRLVAASQNGQIFLYDPVKDKFDQWLSLSERLGQKDWISNMWVSPEGELWISTSQGIYIYSDNGLISFGNASGGYSFLFPVGEDELFALADGRFMLISARDRTSTELPGRYDGLLSAAGFDPYGRRMLLGTYQGGMLEYSLPERKLSRLNDMPDTGFIIRSILVPDSLTVMVGMEGGGVLMKDRKTGAIRETLRDDLDSPSALKGNSVFAMATDRQGRLWVATTSAGLQYSDSQDFEVEHFVHRYGDPASLLNNEINHLLTDGNGFVWVATNDGISRMNPTDGSCRNLYGGRHLSVLSLSEDNQGRIYASTYGAGVYVIDAKTCGEVCHFSGNAAEIFGKGFYVFASFTDSDGDIWFGGVKGKIICYSPSKNTFRAYGAHPVFCFSEKSSGIILAGGGDGLIAIDKKSGAEEIVLSGNVVQQILMDGNVMWLCTSGNGIICIDSRSGHRSSITVGDGLPSNFTRSMVKSDGKLWIGTALGLCCYDIYAGKMLSLPGKDILTGNAFRENSQCELRDGRLAFGTNNGIVAFYPEGILAFRSSGKIYISDIRLSGRSIRSYSDFDLTVPLDSLRSLKLDYPHNSFTLSLLPIGNVGSNVSYSWKLEGLDREWTELSPIPLINYINLKPGVYVLKIRMYDGGMVSEREFQFSVRPPFWQTVWFRMIVGVGIIMLLVILVRHYLRGVRRKAAFEKILLAYQISSGSGRLLGIEMRGAEESASIDVNNEDEPGKGVEDVVATEVEETDPECQNEKQTESKAMDEAFLARAMECVRRNITNESFGKGDFASAMMISQSLLYKKIKAITDMSVVEFIRSIRLNHAMTLLRSGKYNVTEVSDMCGFSSSAYFSRVFKDGFGKSPSEMIPKKDSSVSRKSESV